MASAAGEIALVGRKTSATAMERKTVTLRTKDLKDVQVELPVAQQFANIKNLIDDTTITTVPVPNVDGETLAKVIEYCTRHAEGGYVKGKGKAPIDHQLEEWDAELVNVRQDQLYDLLTAAHHLGIKELLELCCQAVADMIKGKSPEEIRAMLHMRNDLVVPERSRCFCL